MGIILADSLRSCAPMTLCPDCHELMIKTQKMLRFFPKGKPYRAPFLTHIGITLSVYNILHPSFFVNSICVVFIQTSC
jgi:hypothetical protein